VRDYPYAGLRFGGTRSQYRRCWQHLVQNQSVEIGSPNKTRLVFVSFCGALLRRGDSTNQRTPLTIARPTARRLGRYNDDNCERNCFASWLLILWTPPDLQRKTFPPLLIILLPTPRLIPDPSLLPLSNKTLFVSRSTSNKRTISILPH